MTTIGTKIDLAALATVSGGGSASTPIPLYGRPGWTSQAKGDGPDVLVRAIDPFGVKGPWRRT